MRCCGDAQQLNITLRTGSRVTQIVAPTDDDASFTITHSSGTLSRDRVIVSTGGRSLPRSGSDGGGWEILRQLGHTVTPTYAALVPLVLAPQMFHAELAGISQEVELSIFVARQARSIIAPAACSGRTSASAGQW